MKMLIDFSVPNKTFKIERGCRPGLYKTPKGVKNETQYCDYTYKNQPNITCEQCDDYFCNSAENQQIVRFWLFIVALFVVFYMQRRA